MNTTMQKISMAVGAVTLVIGMTGNAGATSALTFSSCGGGVSCASFQSFVSGNFTDSYGFEVSQSSGLGAAAFGIDFSTFSGINNFDMALYQGDALLESGTSFNYPSLSNGFYSLVVTGNASFIPGGFYSGVAAIIPVPEASTWVMILAGIGLVGLALQRKPERAELITA